MDWLTLSGMPVFDTLQPRGEERTYNNPMMDCSSMDESKTIDITFEDLDVMSAHDRLRDGNRLKTVHFQTGDDHRSLDVGFSESDDDWITNPHNHPQPDMLDMQFPTLSDDEQSNGEMLELGFPPESDVGDVLDLGVSISMSVIRPDTQMRVLEMGFNMNHVDELAGLKE
ncbi:hypothetical protein DFJ58DRAFT_846736 [Suillus subalutaceus]|uniref:uncharacterized protein n=1 Tax=Suillus subalutaceus TaxID=48586 RepID=UPI001B86D584|nr:uncharacterized protein DFJ58DRAFT_846736 [Suillus subalutaceus]KAG1836809.1 hypothetical protein DFJ58DRAFT_846736 [Suillus subalutaceus]